MNHTNSPVFDNGNIKISLLDGVPLVEIYYNGELGLTDVEWASRIILHKLGLPPHHPVTSIINRVGAYSLSEEALARMEVLMKDACCVAYVSRSKIQEILAQFAGDMYLSGKRVANFHSINDAHEWIKMNINSASV